jgi:hypothetical protein
MRCAEQDFPHSCDIWETMPRRLAVGFMTYLQSQAEEPEETPHMSMQSHLSELERRHQALEAEIAEALAHPSTDDLKIAELKRRKLQVKDEIARLRQDASASVH